jgi:hypothetical protein
VSAILASGYRFRVWEPAPEAAAAAAAAGRLAAARPGKNVSLEAFLAQDAAAVQAMVSQNVLPVVHGGAATTALLVIDIEQPARPDGFHALDSSTLVRVVNALRLRVAALKHAMPRCSVSFYGTYACTANLDFNRLQLLPTPSIQ